MTDRVRIRVTTDGKEVLRELVFDDRKLCDLSFIETLELALQVMSSLRYDNPRKA
jgi:hypothetical protein